MLIDKERFCKKNYRKDLSWRLTTKWTVFVLSMISTSMVAEPFLFLAHGSTLRIHETKKHFISSQVLNLEISKAGRWS